MTAAGDLPPETSRLVRGLRELKDRTGLSLVALAARTGYSKSSWERYLNGKTLPPRRAVESLCLLAGEPPARLVALRGFAAQAAGRPDPPPAPDPPRQAEEPSRRRRWALPAGVAAGCAVMAALGMSLWPDSAAPSQLVPRCQGVACEGRSPGSTMCGAQQTTVTRSYEADGDEVEIRYSPRCRTVWARVSKSHVGDGIEITVAGGQTQAAWVTDGFDAQGYVYTAMAALGTRHDARVCLRPAAGGRHCFTEHLRQ